MKNFLFGLTILFVFASCSQDDDSADSIVEIPTNLTTTVTVNEKTVSITATADGAASG